jgi:Phage integrase family
MGGNVVTSARSRKRRARVATLACPAPFWRLSDATGSDRRKSSCPWDRPIRTVGLYLQTSSGLVGLPDGISTLYRSIVKRAKLGALWFHDLRHTAASLTLERGLPITSVAAIPGHANTSTTLSVYAHAIKGSEHRAAALMEGILTGSLPEPLNPEGRSIAEARWPNEGQSESETREVRQKPI